MKIMKEWTFVAEKEPQTRPKIKKCLRRVFHKPIKSFRKKGFAWIRILPLEINDLKTFYCF